MPNPQHRIRRCAVLPRCVLAAFFLLAAAAGQAYETDQVSNRLAPLNDSTDALNGHVNAALEKIVADWRGPRDERRMVNAVYKSLGGLYWVHHIEAWAWDSPNVDKINLKRHQSFYAGLPFWATRVTKIFGIGPTLKVNQVRIGTDKLGHFIAQGRKFYFRWTRTHDEAEAAQRSAYTERAIFGAATTGSYSNADLVSNYEGHRFFRSLFEDRINSDKPAILGWQDGRWVIQRPFDFRDYVNAYWDESLNVNGYDCLLKPYMVKRLMAFCPVRAEDPTRFDIDRNVDAELTARYAILDLSDNKDLRLSNLCR